MGYLSEVPLRFQLLRAQPRLLVRPRIVLVPGIMGSQLVESGGSVLWGDASMLSWAPRMSQWMTAMQQGNGIDVPGRVVPGGYLRIRFPLRATAMAAAMALSPAAALALRSAKLRDIDINPYGEAVDYFTARLGAASVLPFTYDWRLANEYNAQRLKRAIDQKWGDSLNDPLQPLTIVAHSMGGLISRYYVEQLGGDRTVRNLVTVGTPHDGSPEALRVPSNLPSMARFLLPLDIVKLLAQPAIMAPLTLVMPTLQLFSTSFLRALQAMVLHFNSVYQLLPNMPFVYPNTTASSLEPLAATFGMLQRQVCASNAALKLICSRPIGDLRRFNAQLHGRARSVPPGVTYYCVVSHNLLTTVACRREPSGNLLALQQQCGDGTVPAASAMMPPATNVLNRFVASTWAHSDLLHDRSVLELALNVARGNGAAPVTGIRDVPPTCAAPGTITSMRHAPLVPVAA